MRIVLRILRGRMSKSWDETVVLIAMSARDKSGTGWKQMMADDEERGQWMRSNNLRCFKQAGVDDTAALSKREGAAMNNLE